MARGRARLCMHTCVRVFARGSEGPCVRMGTDSHHVSQPAPPLDGHESLFVASENRMLPIIHDSAMCPYKWGNRGTERGAVCLTSEPAEGGGGT